MRVMSQSLPSLQCPKWSQGSLALTSYSVVEIHWLKSPDKGSHSFSQFSVEVEKEKTEEALFVAAEKVV